MGDFVIAQQQAAAAALDLMDPETVTYTPYNGVARSIEGFLDRQPPEAVGPVDGVPTAVLRVRNDATVGIDAASLDTGGDVVAFPLKWGSSSTKNARILQVLSVDAAWLTLAIG